MKRNYHRFCITTGLCTAFAMLIAMSAISFTIRIMPGARSLVADNDAKVSHPSNSELLEISVIEPSGIEFEDSDKLRKTYSACKKIVNSRKKNQQEKELSTSSEAEKTAEESSASTTASTTEAIEDQTTVTTTLPSQSTTTPITAATTEADAQSDDNSKVSNGQKPFNYNDVSSIASDMVTLGDFVSIVMPDSVSWDTEDYGENGCVRITLDSDYGSVVLDVKPLIQSDESYLIDGEKSGSVSGSGVADLQWYKENKEAGCNISSVIWRSPDFGIKSVRGVTVGTSLAGLTDKFLCVNGGATTLYRASDVIKDQNKLNAILSNENLYTFVGGRVYSIGSYLEKYYHGKENTFLFEDCDYIVQYGCNSIMEHNYTSGSWIIEYAVKEDVVIGINFMNKSYYKNESKPIVSTNMSSGSESGTTVVRTETTFISEEKEDTQTVDLSEEVPEELQNEEDNIDNE